MQQNLGALALTGFGEFWCFLFRAAGQAFVRGRLKCLNGVEIQASAVLCRLPFIKPHRISQMSDGVCHSFQRWQLFSSSSTLPFTWMWSALQLKKCHYPWFIEGKSRWKWEKISSKATWDSDRNMSRITVITNRRTKKGNTVNVPPADNKVTQSITIWVFYHPWSTWNMIYSDKIQPVVLNL